MGKARKAESLASQAAGVIREALGSTHCSYARALSALANLHTFAGAYELAEPLLQQALQISKGNRAIASVIQSERQQIAMSQADRYQVDLYVLLAVVANISADRVYREVLAWKGATTVGQTMDRIVAAQPELSPLARELQQASARLAALVLAAPPIKQHIGWQTQIAELSRERERLEARLSEKSELYRRSRTPVTLEQLKESLPESAALVDLFTFTAINPDKIPHTPAFSPGAGEAQLAAFIVQRNGPVTLHLLGAAEAIGELVDDWRGATNDHPIVWAARPPRWSTSF